MPLQLIRAVVFLTLISLPVWVAVRAKINLSRRKRNERLLIERELILLILFIYAVAVAAITVVPLPISRFRDPRYSGLNFIPVFNSVRCLLPTRTAAQNPMARFCLQNIIGNIFLFLPLGVLLPLVSEKLRSVKRVLLIALFFSLSIELIQLLSRFFGSFRSIDVDDVLLNTLGAFLGFIIYTMVQNVYSKKSAKLPRL